MTRYSVQSVDPTKTASARGAYLRTSFKNTYEVAGAIRGWNLQKALAYLDQVTDHKRAIPFRKHAGSIGRTGQGKEFGVTKARWPVKSIKFVQDLLQNAQANAETKGLDKETLVISHIQVNQAPKQRRRTYRAHGRINAYQSSPSHIELILSEPAEEIAKAKESSLAHISSRQRGRIAAQKRISA
ncbi:60S ribosomal protein [Yarrowia sp. C11]|nr:60S ribosomal protein [Yarrowia sp. E02]KAG5371752.1 60S ribosomal protein [Yarrowia sp. C11]